MCLFVSSLPQPLIKGFRVGLSLAPGFHADKMLHVGFRMHLVIIMFAWLSVQRRCLVVQGDLLESSISSERWAQMFVGTVCGRVLGLGSTPRLLRLRIRTRTTRIRILYIRAAANKDSSLGEDYVSRLLRERPSQVEPKYLIGDELYTLREKQRLETPLWKRAVETVQNRFAKVGSETPSQPEDEIPVPSKKSDANERQKQVFLSDLLREYRGNLYVPEEAFSGHVSELEEFNRLLDVLPEMTFESFLKAMNAQQVEMLTSRGHASPRGEFVYYDFIVDLKSIPGEQHLQRRHW